MLGLTYKNIKNVVPPQLESRSHLILLHFTSTLWEYTEIYNDSYVKKYATALIKKQWGANLIKFNGVQMLGGVQMNGEIIYQQADEEIKLLEEQMLNGFGLPADMMMG